MELLETIHSPEDIKKLSTKELLQLSNEIREFLINKISKVGGHLAPNLGVIELTIAMHYVFHSPKDKFVFDVSHQCYTHKLLTGRLAGFKKFKETREISGYTNKWESEHDLFNVGHTSTSISLATGLAKARDLRKEQENIIAVIGDGSLSGGEAFEGFDYAGTLNSNFIVIVNDNEMSIAENYGGLYGNLQELRQTKGMADNNFFKVFGFEYIYLEEGNDIQALIATLEKVKDSKKPVVVHIHTKKGKGYLPAEEHPEKFHYTSDFNIETGENKEKTTPGSGVDIIKKFAIEKMQQNPEAVTINAATPGLFGFSSEIRKENKNYIDVGIAEEHAIAFASGLATNGAKPIVLLSASFMQRAYDQIAQDLCLNQVPVVIGVKSEGITQTDMTHLAMYDIGMLSNIPGFTYMEPISKKDLAVMLEWAYQQEFPIGIRISTKELKELEKDVSDQIQLNTFVQVQQGSQIAIIGAGRFFNLAQEVAEKLAKQGIQATIINPRFLTGLDENMLTQLLKNHHTVITLENGILEGGFGEKIARFYADKPMKVYTFGAKKEIVDRIPEKELMQRYGLTAEQIIHTIL